MKWLVFLLLFCGPASAQMGQIPAWPPLVPEGNSAYAGPGDIVSATAWWGLRAYSAAKAGTKAANICNSGDANCADVNTLSNGNFDVVTAQAAPLNCGTTGGTCTVKVLYDQSGTNACSGAVACNMSQATAALRPALTFNCINARPCMTGGAGIGPLATSANSTIAQPFTLVAMAQRTAKLTGFNTMISNGVGSIGLYFSTTDNADLIIGVDHRFTATSNAWHAIMAVASGTSSLGVVDGTTTALSTPTTGFTSADKINSFTDNDIADALNGTMAELGVWSSALSGGNITALNAQIHSYYGF